MSKFPGFLTGAAMALSLFSAAPSWGQQSEDTEQLAAEKAIEQAAEEQAAINKAAAKLRNEQDKSGSPLLDVGVDAATAKEAERERLTERQHLYYTYPPAARYLQRRPFFYQNAVPNYFYGGVWPRGYRLGPFYIDPNVGNHF